MPQHLPRATARIYSGRFWSSLLFVGLASCNQGAPTQEESQGPWLRETSGIRGIFEEPSGDLYVTSTEWTARIGPSQAGEDSETTITYLEDGGAKVLLSSLQIDAQGRLWSQGPQGIYQVGVESPAPIPRDYSRKDAWDTRQTDLWFPADGGVELSEAEGAWGVYRLRDGAATFLAFPDPPPGERAKFYALTSPAMRGRDGRLWFGTFNAAFGFDGKTWEILGRERLGLGEDPRHIGIRGYHMDRKGNLWMADNGAGLFVYDGNEVLHFTAHHDLEEHDTDGPSLHRTFCVAEDTDGTLWIGTVYSGIWRYEPSAEDPLRKGKFTQFGPEDGWPCKNAWTIYRTSSGELLFAGENPGGVYRFDGTRFERVY